MKQNCGKYSKRYEFQSEHASVQNLTRSV